MQQRTHVTGSVTRPNWCRCTTSPAIEATEAHAAARARHRQHHAAELLTLRQVAAIDRTAAHAPDRTLRRQRPHGRAADAAPRRRRSVLPRRVQQLAHVVDDRAAHDLGCPVSGGQRRRVDLHQGHRLRRTLRKSRTAQLCREGGSTGQTCDQSCHRSLLSIDDVHQKHPGPQSIPPPAFSRGITFSAHPSSRPRRAG
jgi:hypothetical protein